MFADSITFIREMFNVLRVTYSTYSMCNINPHLGERHQHIPPIPRVFDGFVRRCQHAVREHNA